MGTLSGFAPWIIYWALVGNVPFSVASLTALGVALLSLVIGRICGLPTRALEIGSTGTFSVVTALTLVSSQSFVAQWILPVSMVGLVVVALAVLATGTPLVGEPVAVGPGADATRAELVGQMNTQLNQLWAAILTAMAISAALPPIVMGHKLIEDSGVPLSIVFSWVVPLTLFCLAALASRLAEDRVTARLANPETVRRTTFVAFRELAIDELYYLAREKAEREVGAGMEAYDVKLGGMGVSLTGDESRESWPATYKVRARR